MRNAFSSTTPDLKIEYETVRERKKMAYEGIVTLVVTVNSASGELETAPRIIAHGVRGIDGTNGFIKSAQAVIADSFSKASPVQLADDTLLKEYLRLELKRFIQTQTGSRPVITPVIQKI